MSSTVTMDKKSVLSIPPSQEKLAKVTEMNNLTINTVNTSLIISKSSQPRKKTEKQLNPYVIMSYQIIFHFNLVFLRSTRPNSIQLHQFQVKPSIRRLNRLNLYFHRLIGLNSTQCHQNCPTLTHFDLLCHQNCQTQPQ